MAIQFNSIPSKIGVPGAYFEFDGRLARTGLQYRTVRTLVFGHYDETIVNTTPNVPYQTQSLKQVTDIFGRGTMLASMMDCYFTVNPYTEVYCVGIPAIGTAATKTVTLTGVVTTASVFTLYIAGTRYVVATAVGDSANDVAQAIVDEITLNVDAPYTAANAAGVITITARFKGELGNDIQVDTKYQTEVVPEGLTVVIAAGTAGSGTPDVSTALSVIESLDFTDFVFPFTDAFNMQLVEQELDNRWLPLPPASSLGSGEKDAHLWQAFRGTETQLAAWHENRNNQHVTTLALEPSTTVGTVSYAGFMSPSWVVAAAYGALGSYYFGISPNINFQNIEIPCLVGAPFPSRWKWNERNRLILNYGFATHKYSIDGIGDDVIIERSVTNNKYTVNGAQTDAEMNTETQKLNSYLRWDLKNYLLLTYPNHLLADDSPRVSRNQKVTTPNRIRAVIYDRAETWFDAGLIENLEDFKAWLIVERSTADCDTVNILIRPDHVNQLRVMAGQILYKVC